MESETKQSQSNSSPHHWLWFVTLYILSVIVIVAVTFGLRWFVGEFYS